MSPSSSALPSPPSSSHSHRRAPTSAPTGSPQIAVPLPSITPKPSVDHSPPLRHLAYAVPLSIDLSNRRTDCPNTSLCHDEPSLASSSSTPLSAKPEPSDSSHKRSFDDRNLFVAPARARSLKGKEREGWELRTWTDSDYSRKGRPWAHREMRALPLGEVAHIEDARRKLEKRLPYAEGYPSCNYVGNAILSCYPESNTTLVQNIYSKFIWNAQYPTFIGSVDVDIYLYNADTEDIATSWRGVENARGMIGIVPDDDWWPTESTDEWFNSRENRTIPYFFVIVDANATLTGGEVHQSTFTVIQTAAPSSLSSSLSVLTASSLSSVSSLSSLSSASLASASSASVSSLSAASRSSASASSRSNRPASGTPGSGALQTSPSSSTSLPKWAIAIIVILGFFALLAGAVAVYFCLGRLRKRRRAAEMEVLAAEAGERGDEDEGEDEVTNGSRDPILGAAAGGPGSSAGVGGGGGGGRAALAPALLGAGAGGAAVGAVAAAARDKDPEKDEGGTISQTDAARMAEAFRAALRKPEFLPPPAAESSGESTPGLGPSPTGRAEGDNSHGSNGEETGILGRELMEDELRSEGKSMKNVDGGKRWGA
ncbi:hypothetical protein JCM1840_000421 [Sporobolomyces johnsonii]